MVILGVAFYTNFYLGFVFVGFSFLLHGFIKFKLLKLKIFQLSALQKEVCLKLFDYIGNISLVRLLMFLQLKCKINKDLKTYELSIDLYVS